MKIFQTSRLFASCLARCSRSLFLLSSSFCLPSSSLFFFLSLSMWDLRALQVLAGIFGLSWMIGATFGFSGRFGATRQSFIVV